MTKALVLDLDGTLLNSNNKISNYTLKILHQWKKDNNLIIIATFRSLRKLKVLDIPNFADYIIYNDGAEILKANKIILKNQLDKFTTKKIITQFVSDNLKCGIEVNDNFYCNFVNDITNLDKNSKELSLSHISKADKIIVYDKFLFEDKNLRCTYLNESFTAIKQKNACKEFCVNYIIKKENLDKNFIYVFGNDLNDKGLFENFPNSIAVKNAHEELKSKATFLTESNNKNGVALFVKKLLGETNVKR